MKGQAKRFVNHKGDAYEYDTHNDGGAEGEGKRETNKEEDFKGDGEQEDHVGFFALWRYATVSERLLTILGVILSWGCSLGVIAAVAIYGELTALFVQRHKAAETPAHARILPLFGGGRRLPAGNRSLHMDALSEDSLSFLWASLAVMALQWATAAAAVTCANWAANNMVTRLRWKLLRAVLRQEEAFFDTNDTLNLATALTEDMEKVRSGTGEHVVMATYLGGTVVCGVSLALAYGWQLTLVALTVVPIAVGVAALVSKYQTRCALEEVVSYGTAGRVVEEALANIRTVRAYGGEDIEVERYSSALAPASRWSRRRGVWAGAGAGAGWLLTYALNALVFAYGAVLVARDLALPPPQQEYHPGVLVTVLFCTFMSAQNIAMCGPHVEVFNAACGAARPLYALLTRRPRIDALGEGGERPAAFKGDILFDNVYFNYPSRSDVKVLRGLSLSVKAGETVALVGGSGCGKSTVLQLLQRLYEPHSGLVSVDGVPVERLALPHYRAAIGAVGQEPVLFSGSIRDNMTLGRDVSDHELHEAAKTAFAHQFIMKLADGYDTMLGERGASLSGGQKQRVAIARAVLRRPALLLLDEPTSALDPAAERTVQAAIDRASAGRTTLVVSHRLSTIVNADRIVYMEQGAVLEQGSHTELMEKKGLYWKLVQEDLTSRSISSTLAEAEADADDEVVEDKELNRCFSRESNVRASSRQSCAVRGSVRSSLSAAHLPAVTAVTAAAHSLTPQEVEESEESAKEAPASTWSLLKLNAPEWPLLAGGGVASFLIGATMPAFALLFSKLYGMFSSSSAEEILAQSQLYASLFAGVAALCGLVTFLQTWLLNSAGTRLTARLRERCFTNYLRQEQGWFDQPENSVGALCARLATDCANVQGATGTRLGTVLQSVSTMAIGVGLSLPYSWRMTLVSLLSVPLVIGGIYLEGWVTRRAEVRGRRALERSSRIATEAVANVRTVHSLGVENTIMSRYLSALREAAAQARTSLAVRGPVYGLCLCAPTLGYAVSLAYGGWLIARRDMPYEYAILVSEALIYGAWMLAEALSFAPSFAAARRSGARILAALGRRPAVCSDPAARDDPAWSATGELDFNKVDFSYPTRRNTKVLRSLSLSLPAGKSAALVGASGCGKSTILQLLLRSYDPDSGTVSVDGADVRSLPLGRLRAQLGLVQQEPALFSRSVRDNIAYGALSRASPLPDHEVVAAARQANVHNFICSLPQGYDTPLGPGGASLSGGQKQRVAIARALVRQPRVLLLDEATAALDAASEKSVQAALEAAAGAAGRTTLVVAHRLATVRHVHTIHVLDRGVVAESGTHEQLVRKRGLYWDLLQQQAPANR